MKPVCVPCGLFYRPEKNGYMVEEGMQGNDPLGKLQEGWGSYKLWRGDKWKCRGCDNEIVVGFASQPISEHYMGDYKDLRQKLIESGNLETFVSDC
jgi:rubredoxin